MWTTSQPHLGQQQVHPRGSRYLDFEAIRVDGKLIEQVGGDDPPLLVRGLQARTVAYIGWFGPRGIASILFVTLVLDPAALLRARRGLERGEDLPPWWSPEDRRGGGRRRLDRLPNLRLSRGIAKARSGRHPSRGRWHQHLEE